MRALAVPVLLALASSAAAGEFRSIAESGATMYDAPSVRAKKLFVASRFYPVEIVINIDNWVKVRDQAGDLDARQAASDAAALVFRAQRGVALDVAEPAAGGWIRVRHAEGQTGYIKTSQVWGL